MEPLLWSLAYLALGLVLATVLLSCAAAIVLLIGGLRAHHRAGRARLADAREREAWQRFCDRNRDIDVDAT